jgi:hypothetical protein
MIAGMRRSRDDGHRVGVSDALRAVKIEGRKQEVPCDGVADAVQQWFQHHADNTLSEVDAYRYGGA